MTQISILQGLVTIIDTCGSSLDPEAQQKIVEMIDQLSSFEEELSGQFPSVAWLWEYIDYDQALHENGFFRNAMPESIKYYRASDIDRLLAAISFDLDEDSAGYKLYKKWKNGESE